MSDSRQNLVHSSPWTHASHCLQYLSGLRLPHYVTGTESKEFCREKLCVFWMTTICPQIFFNSFLILEVWSSWVRTTMRCVWQKHNETYFTGSKKKIHRYWVMYVILESMKFELKAVNTQLCDYFLENYVSHQPTSYQDPKSSLARMSE